MYRRKLCYEKFAPFGKIDVFFNVTVRRKCLPVRQCCKRQVCPKVFAVV